MENRRYFEMDAIEEFDTMVNDYMSNLSEEEWEDVLAELDETAKTDWLRRTDLTAEEVKSWDGTYTHDEALEAYDILEKRMADWTQREKESFWDAAERYVYANEEEEEKALGSYLFICKNLIISPIVGTITY